MSKFKEAILNYDKRRDILIPGDTEETIRTCVEQFIEIAQNAIDNHSFFTVALSGGQTPNTIYKKLSEPENQKRLDWSKVICFWSDERSVPPDSPESNYHNAMKAGLNQLPLLPDHIFRMPAEHHIEEQAAAYEAQIRTVLPTGSFDLVMLGMGEDGHTASLFPKTHALHASDKLVVANYVPRLNTWRMSLTFECINTAKMIVIYALGKKKAEMVYKVLTSELDVENYPVQNVGTTQHKALWILDQAAGELLRNRA